MKLAIKILTILFLSFAFHHSIIAQGETVEQLGIQYFQNEEYEKALEIFEDLFNKDQNSSYYYSYYINCLIKLEDFDIAEKELKKLARKYPRNPDYRIDLGFVFSLLKNEKKKNNIYDKILKELPRDEVLIAKTANAFYNRGELQYAIKTYLKGRRILVNIIAYDYTLANLYRKTGAIDAMMNEYLDILLRDPSKQSAIQDNLQEMVMQDAHYKTIKEILLKKIQLSHYHAVYINLLSWMYLQKKDFQEAYKQLKALDKRFKKGNANLIKLAGVCISNKAYSVAEDIYQYIIDKGIEEPYYLHAKFGILDVKYQKVKTFQKVDLDEIIELESDYTEFLQKHLYQYKEISEKLILRLSELKAIYLHKVPEAINLLIKYIAIPNLSKPTKAKMRLDLGDYYILYGDIWEATLTYKQVDHMYRDHPIGHEAKYRNARLSFFRGDFNWASDELDVLKASTSELIANDALNLSLLIQDNLGLDTTELPLRKYAKADFYIFKNELDSANAILDSMIIVHPEHALIDEIYYSKGKIEYKKGNFEKAIEFYTKVFTNHSGDILADDALFKAAKIYDNILNISAKARELYEKIIFDYGESVFVVEARERFRALKISIEDVN